MGGQTKVRQGDEIVDMIRRHEQEEEEKRRQAEGMTAGDEYRMMLGMAERQAQEMSEHRKMVEEETRERRREAREKTVEGMEEMMGKAQGTLMLKSAVSSSDSMLMRLREEKEKLKRTAVLSRHLAEAKRDEEAQKMRRTGSKNQVKEGKEDPQTREDEHELLRHLIQDTSEETAPTMSEVTVAPGHDTTAIKAMIVAAAAEEIDRGETTTRAMVVAPATELDKKMKTMIAAAAARQNENAEAASDETTMMISTADRASVWIVMFGDPTNIARQHGVGHHQVETRRLHREDVDTTLEELENMQEEDTLCSRGWPQNDDSQSRSVFRSTFNKV